MRDHQDQVIFEAIKPLAFAVRQILERYSRSHNDAMFENFPKGTCGPTAELLGRYLLESAGMQAGYVGGERPGGITHAWVDVKGIVVDITADQFGQAPVIVTRHSPWHEAWAQEAPRPPICRQDQWPAYPFAAWQAIVDGMRERKL